MLIQNPYKVQRTEECNCILIDMHQKIYVIIPLQDVLVKKIPSPFCWCWMALLLQWHQNVSFLLELINKINVNVSIRVWTIVSF